MPTVRDRLDSNEPPRLAIWKGGRQFRSFMRFAQGYSYPPIFVFLLLRGGTQAESRALARAGFSYRVYPRVISIL